MKFFVIQIQKALDGTFANAIFAFDTIESAKQNYHYFLSANIGSASLAYCMASIMDMNGTVVVKESWFAESAEE